jgi:hypothetical protein
MDDKILLIASEAVSKIAPGLDKVANKVMTDCSS